MFKGVYAALMTILDEKDEICEQRMRTLVDFLIEKGLDGLYVSGNSGQGVYMSVDERKHVMDIVSSQAAGRIRIIAHVGAMTTRDARALATYANDIGLDAISSMPPIYWKYTPDEIINYYRAINESNGLPCFVYYIPTHQSSELSLDTMVQLGEIEQIIGLKFTDSNFYVLQKLLHRMDGKWIAFSGSDQLFLPALTMGVVGSIGTNQNVVPELFRAIYDQFQAGNLRKAMEYQDTFNRLVAVRDRFGLIAPSKAILKLRGIDPGFMREPMTKCLTAGQERELLDDVYAILKACDVFANGDLTRD